MDPRTNGHGRHEAPGGARSRLGAIALGAAAVVALALAGRSVLTSERTQEPSPSAVPATVSPTADPSPSDDGGTSATPAPPEPVPVLDDGRHFVFARSARTDPATLRFDLAEFLTDQAAVEAAEDRGDEALDGYYIVNDNPRLRTLPVGEDVRVRYIPVDACCDLVDGSWDAFVDAVDGTAQGDLDGSAPWWITVRDGRIERIEQQYLP